MNLHHPACPTSSGVQGVPGRPSSHRWLSGLLRRWAAPHPVVPHDGAADDGVIQDALQIHRAPTGLSRDRMLLTLQSSDGRHLGTAALRCTYGQDPFLERPTGNGEPPAVLLQSLFAIITREPFPLFITMH